MIKHDDANRCRIQCSYEIVNKVDRTIIKTIKIFDASNASTVRVGLPAETTVLQKSQPGDFHYSGMHDSGPLPKLKEGGPLALLIGCTKLSKNYNDEFLTRLIEEESVYHAKTPSSTTKVKETRNESPNTVAKKSSSFPIKRRKGQ